MIRSLVFASVTLAAASCQATILSQLTLTFQSNTEPTSVTSGTFETYAVDGVTDSMSSPRLLRTPTIMCRLAFSIDERYDRRTRKMYDSHGPVFASIRGVGLGSYQPHYSVLGSSLTDSICTVGVATGPCAGTLTIAGTPAVYTVPWNEVKMDYTYAPAAGGGFTTSMVVTISNVPEPASLLLVSIGAIAASFARCRR